MGAHRKLVLQRPSVFTSESLSSSPDMETFIISDAFPTAVPEQDIASPMDFDSRSLRDLLDNDTILKKPFSDIIAVVTSLDIDSQEMANEGGTPSPQSLVKILR